MPTFNDAKTIIESLTSVLNQTYNNWELIVINDGSTDETETIVQDFIAKYKLSDQIKYIYQSNQGQLQSIKNAVSYITGDIIYILHSDDVFYDNNVLDSADKFFKNNKCDAIITKKIPTFNKDKNLLTGLINVRRYINKNSVIPKLLINNGGNLYMDMAFVKKETFIKDYFYNYLEWNRPFWCNIEKISLINVKSVDFEFFKYRVFEENYIQSDIGKLVQINGEIRTMVDLSKSYYIPFYKLQNFIYRLFCKFNVEKCFKALYFKKQSKLKQVKNYLILHIKKRLKNTKCLNDPFIVALINFYSKSTSEVIDLTAFDLSKYNIKGSDIRNYILNQNNKVVRFLIEKMNHGFKKIIIKEKDKTYAENILHFLCISPYVEIMIK